MALPGGFAPELVAGWLLAWIRALAVMAWLPLRGRAPWSLGAALFWSVPIACVFAPLMGAVPPAPGRFVGYLLREIVVGIAAGELAGFALRVVYYAAEQIDLAVGFRLAETSMRKRFGVEGLSGWFALTAAAVLLQLRWPQRALVLAARFPAADLGASPVPLDGVAAYLSGFWRATLLVAGPTVILVVGTQLLLSLANRLQPTAALFFVGLPAVVLLLVRGLDQLGAGIGTYVAEEVQRGLTVFQSLGGR